MKIIIDKLQNLWSSEEVRILVLASLGIQIGLIFLAPLRKRSSNAFLLLILWLLYLTADNVAILALGNISNQANPAENGDSGTIPGKLTILWAPFLLLHLGGPDSITSYSVEDNELWWRHLLGLVVQVIITVYIFWQSPPKGWLWVPTILVFISGLIKYAERTHALRLASKGNLQAKIISELRPGNRTMEGGKDNTTSNPVPPHGTTEGSRDNTISNPVRATGTTEDDFISEIEREGEIERESQFIMEGYGWLKIFKRLWVDALFSSDELLLNQDRFSEKSPTEAFKLVAIELSFLYDILHTKAVHIHRTSGCVLRCFSLVSILAALMLFHHLDMQKYASKDIIITYILFGAGLSLEVIATVILVFSDWTVVALTRIEHSKCFASDITAMVKAIFRNGKPRWSRTIGQYNLIEFFLKDKNTVFAWIMRKLKIKDKWDNMHGTRFISLLESLEDIMFTEAIRRAQNVHMYNVLVEARSYRGRKALEYHGQLMNLGWSMRREFDECIILWHLATDICYYKDHSGPSHENKSYRDVSWKISNYMVYLLIKQPLMIQLGYGKTRFDLNIAAVSSITKKKFKKFRGEATFAHRIAIDVLDQKNEVAAQELVPGDNCQLESKRGTLSLKTIWENVRCWSRRKDEEDKRKYEDEMGSLVLRDGLRLAEELSILKPEIRWKLISEIWMEMLIYAAIHCDSYQHAKSLSRGGELLTHLWLLMAHLGVVEEHMIQRYEDDIV